MSNNSENIESSNDAYESKRMRRTGNFKSNILGNSLVGNNSEKIHANVGLTSCEKSMDSKQQTFSDWETVINA